MTFMKKMSTRYLYRATIFRVCAPLVLDKIASEIQLTGCVVLPLRPFIMRIRFRASDFSLAAKIKLSRTKSKQASCAEIMLGSFVFLLV